LERAATIPSGESLMKMAIAILVCAFALQAQQTFDLVLNRGNTFMY
jgi:hypothetical protein